MGRASGSEANPHVLDGGEGVVDRRFNFLIIYIYIRQAVMPPPTPIVDLNTVCEHGRRGIFCKDCGFSRTPDCVTRSSVRHPTRHPPRDRSRTVEDSDDDDSALVIPLTSSKRPRDQKPGDLLPVLSLSPGSAEGLPPSRATLKRPREPADTAATALPTRTARLKAAAAADDGGRRAEVAALLHELALPRPGNPSPGSATAQQWNSDEELAIFQTEMCLDETD